MAVGRRKPVKHITHLKNLRHYLEDFRHPDHLEYDLSTIRTYSGLSRENIFVLAEEALALINKPGKRGRRLETIAHYFIFRFADGTNLTADERDFYETEMVRVGFPDGLCFSNNHNNTLCHCTDFNFVRMGWVGNPPRALRTNQDDLLTNMRCISNLLIEKMNIRRKELGRARIIGVLDVMRYNARKRRASLIEDDVIKAKQTQDVTAANLVDILAQYGHTCVPHEKPKDYLSVVPLGQKKPIRLDIEELLAAAPSPERELIQDQTRETNFQTERDKIVGQILDLPPPPKRPDLPGSKTR